MKDMGFQACCLWCDESDEVGSSRCKNCIEVHSRIREEIAKSQPDDSFYQFAKELIAMAVAPHRYDNDPIHGPFLEEQQRLAGQYIPKGKEQSEQDVLDIFENQKKVEKKNIIQSVANKNEWKDNPLEPELARKIGDETWKKDDLNTTEYHAGRTIPSRVIDSVDRSDRVGEDSEMVTRTNIKAKTKNLDEGIVEILENEELHQKMVRKDAWDSTVSDVLDLLDNED